MGSAGNVSSGGNIGDAFQTLPDFLSDGHIHSSSTAGRQHLAQQDEELNDIRSAIDSAGSSKTATRSLINSLRLDNTR